MINRDIKTGYENLVAFAVIGVFGFKLAINNFNFRSLENDIFIGGFCVMYLIFIVVHKFWKGTWFQTEEEREAHENRVRINRENLSKFYADISKFFFKVLFYASIVLILSLTAIYFLVYLKN